MDTLTPGFAEGGCDCRTVRYRLTSRPMIVHDVIALDIGADEVLSRLDLELQACAPKKTA